MDWTAFLEAFARLSPAAIMAIVVLGVLYVMVKGLLPALRAQTEAQAMANQQQLLIRQSYAELIERAEVVYKRELNELKIDLQREVERREGLEARVAVMDLEAAALKQELAEKSTELEKAQAEIVELRACNAEIEAKVTALQAENADLRRQLERVEAERRETADARDEAERRVTELEGEVERLKTRVDELKRELERERERNGDGKEAKADDY